MTRVVIQPAGNKDSRKHFVDTIQNPVELAKYKDLIGMNFEALNRLSKDGKIALWGVTSGKNGSNESKYRKLSEGDIVFFTRDSKVFCTAEIAFLFNNEKLARKIWGSDSSNQTWENMYALTNVVEQDIPYAALRNAIGSDAGDNFMGFRPLDLAKSRGALALLGIEDFTWDIAVGEEIKRTELHDRFGGGRFGGIEPSAKTPNVLLFTSAYGSEFGYNFDEELEDGSFLYTGDGQVGPQDPDFGGNKAILEHRKKGRSLRLFEEAEKKTFVRYLGEFELGNQEPEYRVAPDREGNERTVLVFHLTPVGNTKNRSRKEKEPRKASVTFQEPERNVSQSHERSLSATTTIATRREAQLQNRYIDYLRGKGIEVGTVQISIPESNAPLRADLVDKSQMRVIEVKAGITRGYVREAVGQVLEYVYQLKRHRSENWKPAILLPGKPTDDLIGFVESLGIELVWEEGKNFKSK
jgi:hypothetical protein